MRFFLLFEALRGKSGATEDTIRPIVEPLRQRPSVKGERGSSPLPTARAFQESPKTPELWRSVREFASCAAWFSLYGFGAAQRRHAQGKDSDSLKRPLREHCPEVFCNVMSPSHIPMMRGSCQCAWSPLLRVVVQRPTRCATSLLKS